MGLKHTNSKGVDYYLHGRETTLKNGVTRTLYFFKKEPEEGAHCDCPEGYMVSETRNGLPVIKRDPDYVPEVAAPEVSGPES